MNFTSYGAAREVTGSNHVLDIDGARIMVDCGLFQGHRLEAESKNKEMKYDAAGFSSVVLTHGHCDHCGRLPLLAKSGYRGNVHCTPATRDIAGLIMSDTAYIQAKDAQWLKKKRPGHPFEPLFDQSDVTAVLNQFVTVSYGRPFFLEAGVKCMFYDAGHILGSSFTVMELKDGMRIGFTGDMGRAGLPIIRDPEQMPDVDFLVCESTYGNRLHDPVECAMGELADTINSTYKRGGKVIIPAFAVERAQEIIYYLHRLRLDDKIPRMDIFLDSPMASNATTIFRIHQECFDETVREHFLDDNINPFGFDDLHYTTNVEESKKINDIDQPIVIISSSGMCEAGRILHHLKNNVESEKNTILIVGYMAANTLGRSLADRRDEVKIFGQPYKLRAKVKILNTFSAHADYKEIISYVDRLDKTRLRRVFLTHGEDDALENLRKELLSSGVRDVQIVDPGVSYEL